MRQAKAILKDLYEDVPVTPEEEKLGRDVTSIMSMAEHELENMGFEEDEIFLAVITNDEASRLMDKTENREDGYYECMDNNAIVGADREKIHAIFLVNPQNTNEFFTAMLHELGHVHETTQEGFDFSTWQSTVESRLQSEVYASKWAMSRMMELRSDYDRKAGKPDQGVPDVEILGAMIPTLSDALVTHFDGTTKEDFLMESNYMLELHYHAMKLLCKHYDISEGHAKTVFQVLNEKITATESLREIANREDTEEILETILESILKRRRGGDDDSANETIH